MTEYDNEYGYSEGEYETIKENLKENSPLLRALLEANLEDEESLDRLNDATSRGSGEVCGVIGQKGMNVLNIALTSFAYFPFVYNGDVDRDDTSVHSWQVVIIGHQLANMPSQGEILPEIIEAKLMHLKAIKYTDRSTNDFIKSCLLIGACLDEDSNPFEKYINSLDFELPPSHDPTG